MQFHTIPKSDTDVARYNFDVNQPILRILGRNVAEKLKYKIYVLLSHLI